MSKYIEKIDKIEEKLANSNISDAERAELNDLISNARTSINNVNEHNDFLKTKLQIFLKNRNFTDVIDRQALIIYDLKLQNKNEIKSLAAYNFRKDIKDEKLEETLVNEEIKYCEKFNI